MHDRRELTKIGAQLLVALGYDPTDERLQGTPERFGRMWSDFLSAGDGDDNWTTFAHEHVGDQMVVVSGMRVWSMCEHHLLPFWCDVSIGYIPGTRVLGLSKFARIAHRCASRLQLQERLVREIADEVKKATGCVDVGVVARGEHLCMTMRGVRTQALMTSSVCDGVFMNAGTRAEFLSLALGSLAR